MAVPHRPGHLHIMSHRAGIRPPDRISGRGGSFFGLYPSRKGRKGTGKALSSSSKEKGTRRFGHSGKLLTKKHREVMDLTGKLRESATRFRILFEAITDRVVVVDRDHNILMSNLEGVRQKGKCFRQAFGESRECAKCPAEEVFALKTPVTREMSLEEEHYLLQAYPIFDRRGEVKGVLEISRVVTREKNLERQLLQADKLASLGQLVSGIAHEINNPNTFIRGNLPILKEAMSDIFPILDEYHRTHGDLKIARLDYDVFREQAPLLIDDMIEGGVRIKGIVDGLRKFARRDEGLLDKKVDFNAVVESCVRLAGSQIRKTADVTVRLEPGLPPVSGNPQKLKQVVLNILINASQAIEKDRGVITVTTTLEGKEVVLRVKDDGKGMDDRTVRQIFDPFFTTRRRQGGTGLGLSIAYGIMEEHRGRIEVESKPGRGTTFVIRLPRAAGEGQ